MINLRFFFENRAPGFCRKFYSSVTMFNVHCLINRVSVASCRCCLQGKFWKNFGHNEDGKQWLYPEEALYLMDEVSNHLLRHCSSMLITRLKSCMGWRWSYQRLYAGPG